MDVLAVSRLGDEEKELEFLLLRQQLRIVERKQERGRIPRWQKVPLAMLAVRLESAARNGRNGIGSQRAVVQTCYGDRLASGYRATEMGLPAAQETGATAD